MFSFENFINLPLIWGAIISTAILLYILLDGFDLGVGILFPFAPSKRCRDRMMNSISPFWDGNETWIVMGGGGLFAAFPLAYSTIMPALYIPIILMLLFLIFRGIAFEFRFKAKRAKAVWNYSFHFGSLGAAFMQGMILGGFIQGIDVQDRVFVGGAFDWLTPFSITTGITLVCGYILLGSTWLIMKTDGQTQAWARRSAKYIIVLFMVFVGIISLWTPFLNEITNHKWFESEFFYVLLAVGAIVLALLSGLIYGLKKEAEYSPFLCSIGMFFVIYVSLAATLWPWIVPYSITLTDAAATTESQSFLLVGTLILLPVILGYTAYVYYVFRGKASHEHHY